MLSAEPSGYFIGPFPESFGKLFFIQTLFKHKRVQSVRDGKRKPGFLTLFLRYLIEDFL